MNVCPCMHPNLGKPAYSRHRNPGGDRPNGTSPDLTDAQWQRSSRSWRSGRPAGGELMTGRWSRLSCSACAPAALARAAGDLWQSEYTDEPVQSLEAGRHDRPDHGGAGVRADDGLRAAPAAGLRDDQRAKFRRDGFNPWLFARRRHRPRKADEAWEPASVERAA